MGKHEGIARPAQRAAGRRARVLVVDDDPYLCEDLCGILHDAGHDTADAAEGQQALDVLAAQPVELILLDLVLKRSHLSGMDVLRAVAADYPHVPVVIISGEGTIRTAVEATRLGAYDFLEKPVSRERVLLTVRNALERVSLQRERVSLQRERDRLLDEARERYRMVGTSPAIQRIYWLIDRAAASQSRVLIVGESGTGKEMIARAIHHNSDRPAGPFVAVNCAAIPEPLIESELLGHEKGAFTGAAQVRRGKFEQASGGTLFLDEVGDMSLMTQAKTLRALAEKRIERIGGRTSIPIDVRVIAATNKDLEAEMAAGNFREDLFWRLCVITIEVPPLRDRREDIPDLVAHFLERHCRKNDAPLKPLDPAARAMLIEHDWPGNVRQLRNTVERLVVLSDGERITARAAAEALNTPALSVRDDGTVLSLREARDQFERDYISKMLIAHDGKIQESAAALGIDRSHLWRKMQRYGISSTS